MLNREDFFISLFSSSVIGDDGAVIGDFIYSQDAFFENVHFKRDWLSLREIARKSMLVNISDAIVMNAKPKYALLTVAIPKSYSKEELEELAKGFLEVAKEFEIEIIGGDTISNSKLDISITIISKSKKPIYRKGLKSNSLVAFTNSLGSSKRDLKKLLLSNRVGKNSKFRNLKLNPKFFYAIAPYIQVALDISDGLFFELERLSRVNRVGFKSLKKYSKGIGCSGEEYEILFGFDKRYRRKIENLAKKYRVELNIFAKVKRGKFKNICRAHHF